MKKFISLIAIALLAASLAACGPTASGPSGTLIVGTPKMNGDFIAGFLHVFAIVQADAENLARVGDDGQQGQLAVFEGEGMGFGGLGGGTQQVLGDQGLKVGSLGAQEGHKVEHVVAVDDTVGGNALVQKADELHGKSPLKMNREKGRKRNGVRKCVP